MFENSVLVPAYSAFCLLEPATMKPSAHHHSFPFTMEPTPNLIPEKAKVSFLFTRWFFFLITLLYTYPFSWFGYTIAPRDSWVLGVFGRWWTLGKRDEITRTLTSSGVKWYIAFEAWSQCWALTIIQLVRLLLPPSESCDHKHEPQCWTWNLVAQFGGDVTTRQGIGGGKKSLEVGPGRAHPAVASPLSLLVGWEWDEHLLCRVLLLP